MRFPYYEIKDDELECHEQEKFAMTQTLFATYDGKHLLINEPLKLPPNIRVKLIIAVAEEPAATKPENTRFPVIHVTRWPEQISLRRKDLYGDAGR